ncbi:sigma factor-like helix-turn-helix DNA-binding protein [Rhodococcus sp. NPDC003318]|uniref:sigma factor-like helix-turn-helix DNA-binding protein n=1 Tax=Rhodococcus sp. NPDC003318 TaxID=3364503 RepID=UPI0036D1DB10
MSGLSVVADEYDSFDDRRAIERAANGDRDALHQVYTATRSFVTRMFRAELGGTMGVPAADAAAEALVPVVVAALLTDRTGAPLRVAYTEAVVGIEVARRPSGVCASDLLGRLPRHERDVLVLRTVVGLTVAQTAEALSCTVQRIMIDQHAALGTLRRGAGSSIHS